MPTVELRCPTGPRRLLSKLLLRGDHPRVVADNLVELACPDCKRLLRQQGTPVLRVLHQFNLAGELVRSETVLQD